MMSACAVKFALACADPFSSKANGACIPLNNVAPTMKARLFGRVSAAVGLNGYGVIYITPSVTGDMPSFYYSLNNFGGTMVSGSPSAILSSNSNPQTGISRGYCGGSGIGIDQLTNGIADDNQIVNGRIVSVGVRLKYTGTELNRGGQTYCYVSPTHNNVSQFSNSVLNTIQLTAVEPVSRTGCEFSMAPVTTTECEFPMDRSVDGSSTVFQNTNAVYPWSMGESAVAATLDLTPIASFYDLQSGTRVGAPIAVIMFSGTNQNTFEFEMVTHVEYYGTHVSQRTTPTESDPVGAQKVMMADQVVKERQASEPRHKGGWPAMYQALKSVYKEVKPMLVPLAESAVLAML